MTEAIEIKVEGLKELERRLVKQLPAKIGRRVIGSSIKKAAKPMVQAAATGARAGDGSGALSIAMSSWISGKKTRGNTAVTVYVGPRRSNRKAMAAYYSFYTDKTPTPAAFLRGIVHGHLVEWGSKQNSARPFLRPAFDSHGSQLVKSFRSIFGKEIDRAVKRLNKRRRK